MINASNDRPDTSPEALRIMTEFYRAMSPTEKLQRVRDLTLMVNQLALTQIRQRYSTEDDGNHLLRLARRRLGVAIVERAYAASPPRHGA